MSWVIEFRPEVRDDVASAAAWYESREPSLGSEFVEEIIRVWEKLTQDPLVGARRHRSMEVLWTYPERFPYRVIYTIEESEFRILVVAVLHAARHDSRWQQRIG